MKTYEVTAVFAIQATTLVEANSFEEAREKAIEFNLNGDFYPTAEEAFRGDIDTIIVARNGEVKEFRE